MSPLVEVSHQAQMLRMAINAPPANALSLSVIEGLQAGLDAARADEQVRVVVISARGKLFSGGHDLKEMTSHRTDADGGRCFFEQTFGLCSRLMQSIVELPQPVIAEVNGTASAAGCQLVASCDLAYASDAARFGVNGIDVGLFCSTPSVALTRTIGIKSAMEMLLTGKVIDASAALKIGLVNQVVPSGSLRRVVDEIASSIAKKSSLAVRLGKKVVYEQAGMTLADAYACASSVIVENLLAVDAQEGIRDFLHKRQAAEGGS